MTSDSPVLSEIASYGCVVLRGLPGSGKSTLASRLATTHGHVHLEADQHFLIEGNYRFDPARVADAHALVARDALEALQAGRPVVVANTHVRLWEMAALVGAARLAARSICFVHCKGGWGNIHAVPDTVIEAMAQRWEPLPPEFAAHSFDWPA